jgi:hexosaminidase
MTPRFRIENSWSPGNTSGHTTGSSLAPPPGGVLQIHLFNLSQQEIRDFSLCLTTLSWIRGAAMIGNGQLIASEASFHQIAPPEGMILAPGGCWSFEFGPLWRAPSHRGEGVKSAYLQLSDGSLIPVDTGDLVVAGQMPGQTAPRLPEGRPDPGAPYALTPWPASIETQAGPTPALLYPAADTTPEALAAIARVAALHQRLYPASRSIWSLIAVEGGRAVEIGSKTRPASLPASGYRLDFGEIIRLQADDADGLRHGLLALTQMVDGARAAPDRFSFPASGRIGDAPRHGWRGAMLDVSRQFAPPGDVTRFLDLMAWYRFNVFHWHLTDDEGWRIEIEGLPELTAIGALRGPGQAMAAQLGGGATAEGGFYRHAEIRSIVAHAKDLGIDILPEIDMPGHCAALLGARPDLRDPDETAESYRSVQGFFNNALNPAIAQTWQLVGTILDSVVALFPFRLIHVGGDEVAAEAWGASPLAQALMQAEGLCGTFELQSYFLARLKAMLAARGRDLAGWNEVAHGGGVSREGTLLMAWQSAGIGIELAAQGYDVVMTPGQAYYLDMAHSRDFCEPGAGWAGASSVEHCYSYEASGAFPADLAVHLKGIQTCIWTEHFTSRAYCNDLVFPRFLAVAESAWTRPEAKDWLRFAAIAKHHPSL